MTFNKLDIRDLILIVVALYFVFGGASTRHNIKSLKHEIKKIETKEPDKIIFHHWNSDIDANEQDSIIAAWERLMP
ncbi:hypothetical protein LCGC14_0370440 [marine sediment metagenome]|uniref:Uncharacterized protein n=1 Tax=marine sediment metagenome TaxID=412755 RepID=A0A0F9WDR2_9ZZZZ